MNQINKWGPFAAALILGVFGLAWYLYSGQDSFERETSTINKDGEISEIDISDSKRITIKCKNGESYQIVFSENQQNYDELIFNACGAEGAVENGTI